MPPAEEEKKKPLPRPKEKPKPPKPKHKTGPEPKPRQEHAESHWTPGGGAGTLPPDPLSCGDSCSGPCGFLPHCSEQPPAPPATVHIRSSRLPTPLIALSASLLVFSAALLVALLVHRLVRRRRRQRRLARGAAAAGHGDEEEGGHHQVLAGAVAEAAESDGEEDADGGGGVHHVWYIRTKGLDERAIAAIAAVVYDAKKRGGGAGAGTVDDGGVCAVCLAEFSDGETLRLLPRCGHAFHRGCIDTWLRAHVNCPLCRAPVQVACAGGAAAAAAAAPATAAPGGDQPDRNLGVPRRTEDAERGGLMPERAVRRAASMVALPRRAWPDVSSFRAPASSSGREGDMTGLGKIMRLLKFSDAIEMAGMGAGRSVSFSARSCHGLPTRSDEPSAAGVSSDEAPQ